MYGAISDRQRDPVATGHRGRDSVEGIEGETVSNSETLRWGSDWKRKPEPAGWTEDRRPRFGRGLARPCHSAMAAAERPSLELGRLDTLASPCLLIWAL